MNLLNANMRMLLIMSCAIFCNKIKSCYLVLFNYF